MRTVVVRTFGIIPLMNTINVLPRDLMSESRVKGEEKQALSYELMPVYVYTS